MYKLDYTITTLSPVIISKNSGDPNMIATEDYISGSSILGALAYHYIQKNNIKSSNAQEDETFTNWFLKEDIIFCNAYIYDVKNDKTYLPTPLSIHKTKDTAESRQCYDLIFKDAEEISSKTSYLGGFANITGSTIYSCEVKKSLHFHHERDYQKGSTVEGIIFNYESIDAGQTFRGMLLSRQEDTLKAFINAFGASLNLNIGKSRTAQYGRVRLQFSTPTPFALNADYDAEDELSLTFISPAIIYNENGSSTADIKSLHKAIGEDIEIKKAFIKSSQYEGYHSAWRVKKPSEICITEGSCLLIKVNDNALNNLKELELTGIGQRTNEGFGRFLIGLQREEELSVLPFEKEYKKPNIPMPDSVKIICISLIKDQITKQVCIEAINDAKSFSNNITKSLISRLEAMMRKDGKMQIDKLRKTAKDKLEGCDNDKVRLKDFLLKDSQELLKEPISKKSFQIPEITYDPSKDEDFLKKLYTQYWLTFFATMRKELKKGGKGQ